MSKIVLFILLFPFFSFSQEDMDSPKRWRVQAYGGVIAETLDLEARDNYEHQIGESPILGADLFHSFYFSRDRFQFFYGGGFRYLKSVDRLGGSHIETIVTSFMGQSGLFWRPFEDSRWGFGASLGILLFSHGETRLKTGSINRPVGGADAASFLETHLWVMYQWRPDWEMFARVEAFILRQNFGPTLGVAYAF